MTVYQTNIAKEYALTAGFRTAWSGVREILQNALDGHDKGFPMRIEHGKARDRSGIYALKIENNGIALTRDALVLGFSTKRNDYEARGQHGEGLIVGINALLNHGYSVWIRTGDEAWVARHERNERGLEVLVVDIKKQPKFINEFIVEIQGISPEEWDSYREKVLFFGSKSDRRIVLGNGTILLDPKYQNSLFVKGIYVCQLPNDYNFGYDLKINLNRDREVADPWELENTIRNVIMNAVERNLFDLQDIIKVLNNEASGESRAFAYAHFWDVSEFHRKISSDFVEKHGEDAIPVSSIGDAQRVEHFGKKGITVSKAVRNIIEKIEGQLSERLERRALDVDKFYNWSDLSDKEKRNIWDVGARIHPVEGTNYIDKLQIVDFIGANINGSAEVELIDDIPSIKMIRIARKILLDKAQLVRTFVHEAAHKYAGDGDNRHEQEQYRILSEIVANFMDYK